MKVNEKLFIGYVIGSAIAILALIGGVIYLGVQIHQVNNTVQSANSSASDADGTAQSICSAINNIPNVTC